MAPEASVTCRANLHLVERRPCYSVFFSFMGSSATLLLCQRFCNAANSEMRSTPCARNLLVNGEMTEELSMYGTYIRSEVDHI